MLMRTALIFLLIGGLFFALRYLESRALYFPMKALEADPSVAGLPFEDVFFKTSDHKELNGWFIPATGAGDTVLFCHGNGGNISHRLEKLAFFHRMGLNVFIFDYRGYGKSRGRPGEAGLYRDVDAAYRYLLARGIPPGRIIGYGESLGGAVITDLASREPLKALILESTFTSIRDMIAVHYPAVPLWILKSRFDSKGKISTIKVPKLIIHSGDDEIVPFRLGQSLFEAAAAPKDFLKIAGDHNGCFFPAEPRIREKIESLLAQA